MKRTIFLGAITLLCVLGYSMTSRAEDPSPKTGENQDTLLYVRTVPPGAKILLDDKEIGTSDGVFHVEPGVGAVRVELEGYKSNAKQVTIRADGITRVELELKPEDKNGKEGKAANNENASQLTQEGWNLWKKQQYNEAIEKFRQAVQLAPKNEAAWNGLGWASFNSGKRQEAEEAFKRLIALNPNHPAALNGLGQLYLADKKYDEAEKYLLKAAPQAPAAWYGLARLYLLQGKFEPAEKYAQMVVDAGQGDKVAEQMLKAAKEKRIGEGLRMMIEPQPAKEESAAEDKNADAKNKAVKAAEVSPQEDNILNNIGCESGEQTPDSWKQGAEIPGVQYSWDRDVASEGEASLCIEKTAKRYFPIAQWSQTVDREGNDPSLEVSAQVKANRMTKAIIDVVFLDKDGQWISHQWAAYVGSKQNGQPPANHNWKKYSGKVNIPSGTVKLCVALQVYGPGKVWFDDIQARYGK